MSTLRSVSIIGSGNWGSTIAKIVGLNVLKQNDYQQKVKMWVFEEQVNGQKLSELINTLHENPKYLPGIKLPNNIVAVPDILECTKEADILVFVLPHQFVAKVCKSMLPAVKKGAIGVSLIKGLAVGTGLQLISDVIREHLSIPCAVLMGANLAYEVSKEFYCEATVASKSKDIGLELKGLFQNDYFRIGLIQDEAGTELCGALKNIVAVGAGLSDGLGYGDNTKAAIIRLGFMEMRKFIFRFFQDRNPCESTFLQSCGIADLITTCYGGRNKLIGQALTKSNKPVSELEQELLNGQSAQGPLTASEVFILLQKHSLEEEFPLFVAIHRICIRQIEPGQFIECLRNHPEHM